MHRDVRGDIEATETIWTNYANIPDMRRQARSFNQCYLVARIASDSTDIVTLLQGRLG